METTAALLGRDRREPFSDIWISRVPSASNPADCPSRWSLSKLNFLRPVHLCQPKCPTLNQVLEAICWSEKGEISSVMLAVNECRDNAKQATLNATMQFRWDVMQHPFPRSISPLIAVAENKCRVFQIRMCTCQWIAVSKNSQINYLTRYVFMYMNTWLHYMYTLYICLLRVNVYDVAYAMWVCQGRWNHKVTAGLPVSDYGESDWNLGFPWQCCWGHHVWVSCVNSVRVLVVGLCRLYAISTPMLQTNNEQNLFWMRCQRAMSMLNLWIC